MTNYPNAQDNNITLPGVSGVSDEDIAINALRSATFAIEKELGIVPSGVYTDVRARLDILEARINSPASGIVLSDGYTNSPFFIVNTPASVTLSISDGYGAPTESRVDGSIYMRADGYANNEIYVRRGGQWYPLQSDLWVAGGDLSGTYTGQTVIGIRGKSLNASLASVGASQDGYHLTWNNSGPYWEAQTGFIAGGDLAALTGPFGRVSQTVVRLQGRVLSSVAPGGSTSSDGDGLAWDPSTSQWQPRPRAVILDGYVSRSNLRSNKLLQSPIDNTKVGIVNFGSRSVGVTAGAVNDYAAILSGDRHTVTSTYGVAVGGDSHIISGQYGAVLSGLSNTASGQYSFVLGGTSNVASQTYAFIGDGYQHAASGINSVILNGSQSIAAAQYATILNGVGNNVAAGNTYSSVLTGNNNQITGSSASFSTILNGNGNQTSAQNVLIGATTTANVSANYGVVVGGLVNTIGSGSIFAAVLNGNTNLISINSQYALVGNGNNSTLSGNYATVLNANTSVVTGLHALVLNGNNHNLNGTYSIIGNGLNNTISGAPAYAVILDGYSNTVSVTGGSILGGYSNTVSGLWTTVLNGNGNNIAASNTTVLNGSTNTADAASMQCTVLNGTGNGLVGTINGLISGNTNTLTNASNSYVFGGANIVNSASSKIIGSSNTIASGGSFNRIFGNSNVLGTNSTQNTIFGPSNTLVNTSHDNLVAGASNILDAAGGSSVLGANNILNSNFGLVVGQYGKARMYGQQVQANSRFTGGKIGEAQASKLVLTGTGGAGAAITLQLQDAAPTNMTFVDGYSYEMNIRVLVVNTSPISPNPVVPARYIYDVLAHCEGGILVIDHVNQTLATPQSSGTPWTVSVSGFGLAAPVNNQFVIQVDTEAGPPYVQPTNTPSSRRAIATVDMREISRI